MKRIVCFLVLMTMVAVATSYAQARLGIRGGLNISRLNSDHVIQTDDYKITIPDYAMVGYHVGLVSQLQLFNFFIQPEALYTVTRNDIDVYDLNSANPEDADQVLLKLNRFDFPVMLGLKGKVLKAGIGPVITFLISEDSDFESITEYDLKLNRATMGFQAGVGFDIGKFSIDLKYEGSLSKLGEGIRLGNGERMSFDSRISQYIVSFGLFF